MLGHLHLKGIGGAGAPHIFRMERLKDTGPNWLWKHFCINNHAFVPPGLAFEDLDTKYWNMRQVEHGPSDVVLRSCCFLDAMPISQQPMRNPCVIAGPKGGWVTPPFTPRSSGIFQPLLPSWSLLSQLLQVEQRFASLCLKLILTDVASLCWRSSGHRQRGELKAETICWDLACKTQLNRYKLRCDKSICDKSICCQANRPLTWP